MGKEGVGYAERDLFEHPGLSEVLAGMVGAVRRVGDDYWGPCPFHAERTPSFHINGGAWHCFGACATGGGALDLVMRVQGCDKGEALRMLADSLRVPLSDSRRSARPLVLQKVSTIDHGAERNGCLALIQQWRNLRGQDACGRRRSEVACDVRKGLEPGFSVLQWQRFIGDVQMADEPELTALRRRTWDRPAELPGGSVPDLVGHALAVAQTFFAEQPERTALAATRGFTPEQAEAWGIGFAPTTDGLLDRLLAEGVDWDTMQVAGLLASGADRGEMRARFYGRLTIPIHDASGALVAFAGRSLAARPTHKYINSPSAPWYRRREMFYGLNRAWPAIRREQAVTLVEGYFDVMRPHVNGDRAVVGVMGAQLTDAQVAQVREWDVAVTLCLDADGAGTEGAMVSVAALIAAGVWPRVVRLTGAKDPDEWGRAHPTRRLADEPAVRLVDWMSKRWRAILPTIRDPQVGKWVAHHVGLPGSLGDLRMRECP